MKRIVPLLLFSLIIVIAGAGNATAANNWTFMVYLDADNNLESAGIGDFLEMAAVGSDANVRIVVQFDRRDGYDTSYEDWQTCKRFFVTSGMTPIAANQISDLGESNMGDPATLTAFINWATTNYPATNYALVLWNHGGGWREEQEALLKALDMAKTAAKKEEIRRELEKVRRPDFKAVCWDDTNGSDALYMKEVKSALNSATIDMDLVGFDACLMGMIEVAHEIKDTGASVMVGSEETVPGDGWPYNTILSDLKTYYTWTPAQLATDIVNRYYESYSNSETHAAIDLSRMNALSSAVSAFANAMSTYWNTNQGAVKAAAQDVMDELDTAIINEHHGAGWPGAHGLAIYLPATVGEFDSNYNATIIDFAANTLWEEFLSDYYASMGGSWIQDARSMTQEFYYPEHIDLYDFCDNIVTASPPCPPLSGGGFEGGIMPPTGWTRIQNNPSQTWKIDSVSPYEGTYAARCDYDPALVNQNEWIVTPYMTNPSQVTFWSFGSVYWCRDTYDNCDLEVWLINGSGVTDGDDVYLGKADDDWPANWTYAKSTFPLSPSPGTPVRIGFRYFGNDGAQINLDYISVCLEGAGTPCDFDGDGDSDIGVWRPSNGKWYIQGQSAVAWGVSTDIPVPGDYDGDGDSGIAVWRPSNGKWYIQGQSAVAWGVSTDILVPGDYDGDGTTEIAVWRPSNGKWYIQGMSAVAWGVSTDIPVPGDYDGDGTTEIAVWRPSNGKWYIQGMSAVAWGVSTDIPVPGDYDGDGTTEIAVWRPSDGKWYIQGQSAVAWGVSTDIPVPGDYDGDGTTEIAVWRPSNGRWYIQGLSSTPWGVSGDLPLAQNIWILKQTGLIP